MIDENRITYFAQADSRNKKTPFGIKAKDRTKHVYVIGKTGMGKSTLLENMAVQDIQNGEGLAFIDPHGKTADLLLEYVPKERIKDVLYFAPFDLDYPVSFNVLEKVDADKRHLVVSGLMSTFKKIWVDAWSARMEYILANTLLALLEYPDATLLGVNKMLADKEYRKKVVENVTDPAVKSFWIDEFGKYTEKFAAEATPAIQNKIGQFTSNALIRNMIGQPRSSFDIRKMMDEKKIIIINLSKGRVGESNANLLGGMLITKIYLAAMSRADVSPKTLKTLPNFYLYVDEFQSFANESFADILSEARKYNLNLTIAHQYIEQMEEEVRAAVFGNVGTMVTFRVGAYDAEVLEKEFAPQFTAEDLVNLGFTQIYLKLMIDGVSSHPFSATTLPPIKEPEVTYVKEILDASRGQFAQTRQNVEEEIKVWHETISIPAPKKAPPTPTPPHSSPSRSNEQASSSTPPRTSASVPTRFEKKEPSPSAPTQSAAQPLKEAPRAVPAARPSVGQVSSGTALKSHNIGSGTLKSELEKLLTKAHAPQLKTPSAAITAPTSTPAQSVVPPKPLSLQSLKTSAKDDGKVQSKENLNDLRAALSKVVKTEPSPAIPKQQEKPATITPAPQSTPVKEVPEAVLRNVLKVDK